MKELSGRGLAQFAKCKLGMAYVYAFKMIIVTLQKINIYASMYPDMYTKKYIEKATKKVGKLATDCSGLISAYTLKMLGSAQLYQQAYTRIPISKVQDFAIGTVLWKNGHVGVYIGMEYGVPMCIEAKGIDYGVVKTKVSSTAWTHGLTFKWLKYDYSVNLSDKSTWKGVNPYAEPTTTVTSKDVAEAKKVKSYVSSGEAVKWIQWELCEAGYKNEIDDAGGIDGECGPTTVKCIVDFQKSCKITSDGLAGATTRKYLKSN